MRETEKIADKIYGRIDSILDETREEDIAAYAFIMAESRRKKASPVFRFVYEKFYGMGRFVTKNYRDEYFRKMNDKKVDLKKMLKLKSGGKTQYSFSTKLLHTVNPNMPIYDSNIGRALGSIPHKRTVEGYCQHYAKLEEVHRKLQKEKIMKKAISRFKSKFKKFGRFSNVKIVDFLLWEYGRMLKPKKTNK